MDTKEHVLPGKPRTPIPSRRHYGSIRARWWVSFTSYAWLAAAAAYSAPFTIDRVLEDLRATHPQARRVVDELPPGVTAREDILYTEGAAPGEALRLDIYRPTGAGPFPAVLIIHGGGWESGDRAMERPFAKRLAARGYATVPVSYRLGPPGRFPASVHDLKAAVRWLRRHASEHNIDPARIGAVGASAGGQLAALLGASNGEPSLEGAVGEPAMGISSEVQTVVDIDGAVSFPDAALIAQEEAERKATSRFLGGNYSERRETWFAASPLTYVSRRSAPTLFIKSTVSRPILPGRDEMAARLRVLGVDAEVIQFPNTPHPFWLVHPWFEPTLDAADAFLRKHLRP